MESLVIFNSKIFFCKVPDMSKKISDMEFEFTSGINVISGTNGTCKTSLLHIISNAFQAVTKNCSWVNDIKCLQIINNINNGANLKIESLSRGDKQFNDPSNGHKGELLNVEYVNHEPLSFRKHNSGVNNRYAIKPPYKKGTHVSLPNCPVLYLGLARLFPFGEYKNDEAIKAVKGNLPVVYQQEIAELYRVFTHINISAASPQKVSDIKVRTDFSSDTTGIDSNTISAGEDNLYTLLTALVSLKYYYQSIQSNNDIESILLVDEFDATLHPSYQFKLLDLFRKYSTDYKIQVVFTTHSLSLIEYALKKKDNVIYLIDNVTSIIKMSSPDIYKIRMYLDDLTVEDIYVSKLIPVFTEDEEARIFLKLLLEYLRQQPIGFAKVESLFHFVNANIGATNLINIFKDNYLLRSTMQSICILDGDQQLSLSNYTINLPGNASPEKLIMDYSVLLCDNDDDFWKDRTIIDLGYTKINYLNKIRPDIEGIEKTLTELKANGQSTKGIEREKRKKVFNDHQRFFEFLLKYWIHNPINAQEVRSFYKNLWIMFKKTAVFHGINPNIWPEPQILEIETHENGVD
jgi:predicted ATPase